MKLVDLTICGAVLLVAGVMALAPRQRAETPAPPDAASLLAQPAAEGEGASALRAPRDRRARSIDAETVKRCLEVMRDIDPQRADALERLSARQSGSALAESLADKHYLRSLAALKGQNPRLYQMRIEELRLDGNIDLLKNQLIAAIRATGSSVPDLQRQLHELVTQKVAFSLASRGEYLVRLKDQVKVLEDELSHDAETFQSAVEIEFKEQLEQVQATAARAPGG